MAIEKTDPVEDVKEFVYSANMQPTTRIYVGIDPGTEGAIGLLCGNYYTVIDIPTMTVSRAGKTKKGNKRTKEMFDLPAIVRIFRQLKDVKERVHFCLEQAQIMVKGKASSLVYTAFKVGIGYGMWPLFLTSKGYSVEEVVPSVWKKAMSLAGKDKGHSLTVARGLWPQAPLTRKMDHNRAEALLLAEFLRRRHKGE